jgi:hypothetical protein
VSTSVVCGDALVWTLIRSTGLGNAEEAILEVVLRDNSTIDANLRFYVDLRWDSVVDHRL